MYLSKTVNLNFINYSNMGIKNSFFKDYNFYLNTIFVNKITSTHNITLNKNYNYLFKYNKKYFYNHNKNNFFYIKKIHNIFKNLFLSGLNGAVLDSSYKSILPLYNYIYGCKSLYSNKEFFLLDKKNLTRNNWMYSYKKTLKKFNVNVIVILDFMFFKKFLPILKNFNLPIISVVPSKIEPLYLDYYLLANYHNLSLFKFFLFNFFSSLFFKYNKIFLLKNKLNYFKSFNLFLKKIN